MQEKEGAKSSEQFPASMMLRIIEAHQANFQANVQETKEETGMRIKLSMLRWMDVVRQEHPDLPERITLNGMGAILNTKTAQLTKETAGKDEEPGGIEEGTFASRSYEDLDKKSVGTVLNNAAWLEGYAVPAVHSVLKAIGEVLPQQQP